MPLAGVSIALNQRGFFRGLAEAREFAVFRRGIECPEAVTGLLGKALESVRLDVGLAGV